MAKQKYVIPPPHVEKTYKIAVCIKRKGMETYRVDVETTDEYGAMLLARLLQKHDDDVLLTEKTHRIEYARPDVKRYQVERKVK